MLAVLVLGVSSLVMPQPALAQNITVSPPSCQSDDGNLADDGVVTVAIPAALGGTYDVFLDDVRVASGAPSGDQFDVGPIVDGPHTIVVDRVGVGRVGSTSFAVDCDQRTNMGAPDGGVATGGGGLASNTSELPNPLIIFGVGLLVAVGAVGLVRGRLIR